MGTNLNSRIQREIFFLIQFKRFYLASTQACELLLR